MTMFSIYIDDTFSNENIVYSVKYIINLFYLISTNPHIKALFHLTKSRQNIHGN